MFPPAVRAPSADTSTGQLLSSTGSSAGQTRALMMGRCQTQSLADCLHLRADSHSPDKSAHEQATGDAVLPATVTSQRFFIGILFSLYKPGSVVVSLHALFYINVYALLFFFIIKVFFPLRISCFLRCNNLFYNSIRLNVSF